MKKVLMVCNSVMQIMAAVQIRRKLFTEDYGVIAISDFVPNMNELVERINREGVFDQVIALPVRNICFNAKKIKIQHIVRKYKYLDNIGKLDNYDYDVLMSGNIYGMLELYFNRVRNKKVEVYLLQDGNYNYIDEELQKLIFPNLKDKFFHDILKRLKGQFIFSAEYGYNDISKFESYDIPKISEEDKSIYNKIFLYNKRKVYDKKIVFLDQPFEEQGICMKEDELIRPIIEKYGEDKVAIKIHPRTSKTKYSWYLESVIDDEVPLEIIALNNNIDILVTISSSAGIMPCLCMDKSINAIFLYKLRKKEQDVLIDLEVFDKMMNKIMINHKNIQIAMNQEQYRSLLDE